MSAMLKEQELYTPSYTQLPVQQVQQQQQQQPQQPQGNGKAPKAKKGKKGKAKAPKVSAAQMSNGGHGSSSSWSTRAAVSQSNGQRPANAKTMSNKANGKAKHNAKSGSSVSPSASKRAKGKSSKAAKSGKQRGGKQQQSHSGKAMMHQQNNRNIEVVNSVSPELQQWLRTEIKKLNPDVEAASVAHLLLTLDDDTVKTTANHTFGSSGEVKTFVDSFLVHRSHDLAQQKNKTAKGNAGKKHV